MNTHIGGTITARKLLLTTKDSRLIGTKIVSMTAPLAPESGLLDCFRILSSKYSMQSDIVAVAKRRLMPFLKHSLHYTEEYELRN